MRIRFLYSLIAVFFLVTSAHAEAPGGVVVTVKPLHSLVQGVMGDTAEATLLVTGTASPHGFSLKPSQVGALQAATVVFYIDETMETFLKNALDSLPDTVRKLRLSQADGIVLLERRDSGAWEAEDHHGGHSHHAGEEHGDEAHNMHLWLDPRNAVKMVRAINETLAGIYPENAALYTANAARLIARLGALDEELAGRLAPVRDRPFVVLHDAYPYFEARYGLTAVGSLTLEPDSPASAKKLKEIRHKLEATGARCLFREPQFSDRLLRTAAEGLDVNIGTLDPLGGELEPGADLYFILMRTLAGNLADCLAD